MLSGLFQQDKKSSEIAQRQIKTNLNAANLHALPRRPLTRSEDQIARDEQVDVKVLVECTKNDLFPKAKFVLGADEWDVGGMIYKDCIKCCGDRIGLRTMSDIIRESHMKHVWMTVLTRKLQKKALVQKRSATHTVMQNKFTGNLQSEVRDGCEKNKV
jgi:hypothetical protein